MLSRQRNVWLHLHPQTVRYRLGQLRALFGSALDEPASRAALLLALAWSPAVTTADGTSPLVDLAIW
jgi:sugar diacid utilization regulator